MYNKYHNLFDDINEFNIFFDKGEPFFSDEINKRKIIVYINEHSDEIEVMDFKKEKKESLGASLLKDAANMPHSNYQNLNKTRKDLLKLIDNNKNKNYYSDIIEALIKTNKKLNKEWNKNGKYFQNKVDFFDTYLLDDYKKQLKYRKKK